jgi:hypothetical protein
VLHALRLTPSGLVEKELRYTCIDQHMRRRVGLQPLCILRPRQPPPCGHLQCFAVLQELAVITFTRLQVLCMPSCARSLPP